MAQHGRDSMIKNHTYICEFWKSGPNHHNGYGDENRVHKDEAHRVAEAALRSFALDYLKIPKKSFDVRSNKGGVAVCGEVTLHTDPFPGCKAGIYVQFCQYACQDHTIMYRTVKDRRDYTGGPNQYTKVEDAFRSDESLNAFANTIRRLCGDPLL